MVTTSNLGITLVEQAQAQKEVTINQAITTLDALIGNAVADKDLATPPGSPVAGVVYIVAASPTGAWVGKAKYLAYYDQLWRFIAPQTGMCVWVKDESSHYRYSGTAWVIVSGGGGGGSGDMLQATYDPAGVAQQVVGTSATQTLTNKTLTAPAIATISNTGTLTLPTATDTLVGRATTDTLTNKTINGANNSLTVRLASDVSGTLPVANGGTGKTSVTANSVLLGNGTSALAEVAPGTSGNVLTSNGTTWQSSAPTGGSGGTTVNGGLVCNTRLTLTSGVPITTSDVTSAGNVYVTPFGGDKVALYDGTSTWSFLSFTQLTISLASGYTSGKPYDVFLYNNAGSVAAETLVWTNDTTRATALAFQDGIYVKSGATTRRYIGTFYTTSSTTTEDSAGKRYVWNYYNRCPRNWVKPAADASWNYNTGTWRQANANAANQLEGVIGVSEDRTEITVCAPVYNGGGNYSVAIGVGVNSTTTNSAYTGGTSTVPAQTTSIAKYTGFLPLGRVYYAWIENGNSSSGTTTWYGNMSLNLGAIMGLFYG